MGKVIRMVFSGVRNELEKGYWGDQYRNALNEFFRSGRQYLHLYSALSEIFYKGTYLHGAYLEMRHKNPECISSTVAMIIDSLEPVN